MNQEQIIQMAQKCGFSKTHSGVVNLWLANADDLEAFAKLVAEHEREQAQQAEPVAYDKTELNCFAQDLYDQKMREGKRGHYESMFHVIHQCIKRVTPPPRQPLTDEEMKAIWYTMQNIMGWYSFQEIARAIEAAHGIKGQT